MRGDVFRVEVGKVVYFIEEPRQNNGLKATVRAVAEEGNLSRILHADRINLDREADRIQFAKKAGIEPADLLTVRETLLDALVPPATPAAPEPTGIDLDVRRQAEAILDRDDILDGAADVVAALGYAGDLALPQLVYLVLTSRLLDRPINLVVTGPSGAGKSFLAATVIRMFPDSATYSLTGMSERALIYSTADLAHRHLFIAEAAGLHRDGIGAAIMRSICWDGAVRYEVVEKTAAGLQPRLIERPGPTGLLTTTTGKVERELETRVLAMQVPDTEAATRHILRATAAKANGATRTEPDLAPWQSAQSILATDGVGDVTIPYAGQLADRVPAGLVRARRDFSQLLGLIASHALLHQRRRDRDRHGRIVANQRDYEAVFALAAPIFGSIAAQGITPAVRESVAAVKVLATAQQSGAVSVGQVAAHLGLDKSAASRRLRVATDGGFLVNEETRRGRPAKLTGGDPLPEDRPALPPPADVFTSHCNTATLQHPPEVPHDDAETTVAPSVALVQPAATAEGSSVAGVAQPLQWPLQRLFPHNGGETQAIEGECCSVAPGGNGSVSAEDDGTLPAGCIGPSACARLGPCAPHIAGRPCSVSGEPSP